MSESVEWSDGPTPPPPERVEYGLRVSLDAPPAERDVVEPVAAEPSVVQAPATVDGARSSGNRRWLRRTLIGAGVLLLAIAGAVAAVIATNGSSPAGHPRPAGVPATSHTPPTFAPVVSLTAQVPAAPGTAVTPARDGGLWYQPPRGNLTRIAAETGRVSYSFPSQPGALGLVVAGGSIEVLTRSALIERDRGNGRIQRVLPLPTPPVCCGPVAAAGALWTPLASGLARIDLPTGSVGVHPVGRVGGLAGDDTRVWLLSAGSLIPVDPASGQPGQLVDLGGLRSRAIAVGADAIWVAGVQRGRPVVVRFDADSGRRQLAVPLSAPATAVAVADGAVWVAIAGLGVQEIDPSTNRLVGAPIRVDGARSLLAAHGDRLWAIGHERGIATFVRLDLHPTGN